MLQYKFYKRTLVHINNLTISYTPIRFTTNPEECIICFAFDAIWVLYCIITLLKWITACHGAKCKNYVTHVAE